MIKITLPERSGISVAGSNVLPVWRKERRNLVAINGKYITGVRDVNTLLNCDVYEDIFVQTFPSTNLNDFLAHNKLDLKVVFVSWEMELIF